MSEQSVGLGEQDSEQQFTIPEDATHSDILKNTITSLRNRRAVVITGNSRAGKSTFLQHSLTNTLSANHQESSFQNCMAEDPEVVAEVLNTFEGVVVLDEAFRLSHDEGFVKALHNRISDHRPVVVCNTKFPESPQIDEEVKGFVKAIGVDNETAATIDFPLEVNEDDARRVIQTRLAIIKERFNNHGRSINVDLDKFSGKLIELTRNPKLLADIADYAVRSGALETPDVDVNEFVRTLLDQGKLYFEKSLREERKKIKGKLYPQDDAERS